MKLAKRCLKATLISIGALSSIPVMAKGDQKDYVGDLKSDLKVKIESFLESHVDHPGVIGTPDFSIDALGENMAKASDAVGIIALRPKGAFPGNMAIGTIVAGKTEGEAYILTAKHTVYNPKTLERYDTDVVFIHDFTNIEERQANEEYLYIDLSKLPQKLEEFVPDKDFIFIPINRGRWFELSKMHPIKVNGDFNLSGNQKIDLEADWFSISAKRLFVKGQTPVARKFYQSGFNVFINEDLSLFTNMDVLQGMSGTPIFQTIQGQTVLMSIVSRRTRKRGCQEYNELDCRNVLVVPKL